ncbi:uncharacterized protein LAESUDRAFT_348797 [Laetiporus sulphureus 93-53]|uniref:Uncharacterized protein n=1 Tax=Laetiporus sulphureus 93-53 TaxID=1314785 RepID=A0A165GST8_9APHY|nr:uncharacterized protein LAESUDRAFT_348797 [Laetiporus sulphureus 93-53]KZT10762.1 hypothetical protein LAESUDRAFT_348797 [Laetiporus sulphureus 93-53]
MLFSAATIFSLLAIASVSAVPIEFTVPLPDGTLGVTGLTEIPNPPLMNKTTPPHATPSSHEHFEDFRFLDILRRQIRVNNFDATQNASWSSLMNGADILKRNEKTDEEQRARLQALQADPPQPTTPPSGPGLSSFMKAPGSGMQDLGQVRTNGSYAIHSVLADVFSPDGIQQSTATSTASVAKSTFSKNADWTPPPKGPGYTTDTMDVAPPSQPARRDDVQTGQMGPRKRHSMVLDTDALLPDSSNTDATSEATSTPAWQDMGFINIDSNRPPVVSPNITNVTSEVSDAPGNVTSAAASVAASPASSAA